MITKTIEYTDFYGNKRSEEFYFHMPKSKIAEMQLSLTGGLETYIKRIINTTDQKRLTSLFKDLILMTYGEISEDGRGFIQNEEVSKNFSYTGAYDVLYMELLNDEKAAADFVKGVLPEDWKAAIDEEEYKQKVSGLALTGTVEDK